MRRNRTGLYGIDIVDCSIYSDSSGYSPISYTADWDWEEVWGGILRCPKCEEDDPDLWSWGDSSKTVKDIPIGLHPVEIDLQCQWYKCKRCGGMFGTTHPSLKYNSNMTKPLINHVSLRARGAETQALISRRTGVPESTVRKCFHDLFKPPRETTLRPVALGIDELYAGTGKPSTVITEIGRKNRKVFEVLPKKKYDDEEERDPEEELKKYLSGLNPAQDPLPIVTDMASGFMKAVQESRLPTTLIIDRFHLARQANRTLGTVHSELGISSTLKETWEAQKAEIDGEDPEDFGRQLHLGGESKLEVMEAAYKATLWYNWILTADISRGEAKRRIGRWRKELPRPVRGFFEKTVLDTLDELLPQILNYYDHRYTTSYNEAMNNLGKRLERLGAGYSNRTIRAKPLYSQGSRRRLGNSDQHAVADSPCIRAHKGISLPVPIY